MVMWRAKPVTLRWESINTPEAKVQVSRSNRKKQIIGRIMAELTEVIGNNAKWHLHSK